MRAQSLSLLLACSLLAACGSTMPDMSPKTDHQQAASTQTLRQQVTGNWTLNRGSALPDIPEGVTLALQGNSVSDQGSLAIHGRSGVNYYTGGASANWSQQQISIGRLGLTRMAGPPERMAFERAFLAQLEKASSFQLEGAQLTLTTLAGDSLTFTRSQ